MREIAKNMSPLKNFVFVNFCRVIVLFMVLAFVIFAITIAATIISMILGAAIFVVTAIAAFATFVFSVFNGLFGSTVFAMGAIYFVEQQEIGEGVYRRTTVANIRHTSGSRRWPYNKLSR